MRVACSPILVSTALPRMIIGEEVYAFELMNEVAIFRNDD
jgi:hypothetical protein